MWTKILSVKEKEGFKEELLKKQSDDIIELQNKMTLPPKWIDLYDICTEKIAQLKNLSKKDKLTETSS